MYSFLTYESTSCWKVVLNDLISRGLKKVAIFVTDNFPGLKEIIKHLFTNSDHQLCWVHLSIPAQFRHFASSLKSSLKNYLAFLKYPQR